MASGRVGMAGVGGGFIDGLALGEGRPERLRAQMWARRCPVMGCPSGCALGPEDARRRRVAATLRVPLRLWLLNLSATTSRSGKVVHVSTDEPDPTTSETRGLLLSEV